MTLHAKTNTWLQRITESITLLNDRCLLTGKVLTTAVCSMMFNIASYQLAFQRDTVSHPNMSVIAFLNTASIFHLHCPGIAITNHHFVRGCEYYAANLKENGMDDAKLEALLNLTGARRALT